MVGADFQYLGHTMDIANQKFMCQNVDFTAKKDTHFYTYSLAGFLVDSNCSMLFFVHCSLILVPVVNMPGMDLKHFFIWTEIIYFICIGDI